jgi:hypothetical protein
VEEVEGPEKVGERDDRSDHAADASEKKWRSRLDWVLVIILAVTSLCAA